MSVIPLIRRKRITTTSTDRRLALAEIVASGDPGSRLAAAITDGGLGTGLQVQLTGSWTSTDWTGAWPYLVWPLLDSNGLQMTGDEAFTAQLVGRVRTHPGDSSDTDVRLAIVNETDLTTGTIDGVCAGMRWTAAARTSVVALGTNGAASGIIAGPASAGAEGFQAHVPRQGKGSSTILVTPRCCLLDSTGAYVAGSNANAAPANGVPIGTGALYVAAVFGRNAATVGNVTIGIDLFASRAAHTALPGF